MLDILKKKNISKKDLFKLNEDDLMFITNPGRMGDDCGITFVIKKDDEYICYRIWLNESKDDKDSISLDDAFEVFPKWKEKWEEDSDNKRKDTKYIYIYMGFGNGLCVDKRIYDEYEPFLLEEAEILKIKINEVEDGHFLYFDVWDLALAKMINGKPYIYVSVIYEDDIIAEAFGEPKFYYKTDIEDILVDDIVLVDRSGNNTLAKVVEVGYYYESDVPYPIDKTKDVIKIVEYKEHPRCPKCGSRMVKIVYGLPGTELFKKAQKGEIFLGGCCEFEDSPKYHCNNCSKEYLMYLRELK